MKRWKAVSLIIFGVVLCLVGVLLGSNFFPRSLLTRMETEMCVNSKGGTSYYRWLGSLSYYPDNVEFRLMYWNITNKDGFLYNGEVPVVEEVGPYVYRVSSMKKNVVFSAEAVSYQSVANSRFDLAATRLLCPKCNETDKITIPNMAYVGFALQAGDDRTMGSMFIPVAVQFLFTVANKTGATKDHILQQFGNFSGTLLSSFIPGAPSGWGPAGFGPWFSAQNSTPTSQLYRILSSTNRSGYNLTEMMAINNVLTSPSLLGTTGNKTILATCNANVTAPGCGYLFYFQAYTVRKQAFPPNDAVLLQIMQNMKELFCQLPAVCVTLDTATFSALALYVTDHLLKLAFHVAFDRIDFGPLMTRTVKQISQGYEETELKAPPLFPAGIPVKGSMPTGNINSTVDSSTTYYTCKHATKALQIKEINGKSHVSTKIYPNASAAIRKIEGFDTMFGFSIATPCKTVQSSPKSTYIRFDSKLMLKYAIHRKSELKYNSVFTYLFEADRKSLFKTNNMTVFRDGLIDLSKKSNGVPLVASMPHFLYADPALVKLFNTKPSVSAHNTFLAIEPISGSALKVEDRSQMNCAIPEQTVSAPRQRPLNITYKEKRSSTHFSRVIPFLWVDVRAVAPTKQLEIFGTVYKVLDGACVSIVLGSILGAIFIVAGIILLVRSAKTPVHSHLDAE